MAELRELTASAGADIVGEVVQRRPKPDPATLIGSGKVEELKGAISRTDELLARFGSPDGLATSAQRVSDALGNTLVQAGPVGRDLDETIRQAREALVSIRRLADTLQRQPDALVKGLTRTAP